MNLKKLLMDLGNALVTHYSFDPGFRYRGGKPRPNTVPIKDFTDWLNGCPQAQQVLADVGVEWPTATDPHPKVDGIWLGCWVMAGPEGELMQWGIDADTVEPYTDYEMAWAQAKFLAENFDDQEPDVLQPYILNIFSNGKVRLDEYGPDLKYKHQMGNKP